MHKTVQSISKISFSEWKGIFIKVKERIGENNVVIVSAGVGFFGFLAIFPAMMALISIYGFIMALRRLRNKYPKSVQ